MLMILTSPSENFRDKSNSTGAAVEKETAGKHRASWDPRIEILELRTK